MRSTKKKTKLQNYPGVIKLYILVTHTSTDKPGCSLLASVYSLVKCMQIKPGFK